MFLTKGSYNFQKFNLLFNKFSNVKYSRFGKLKKKYFLNMNSYKNPNFILRKRETLRFRFAKPEKYKNKPHWFGFGHTFRDSKKSKFKIKFKKVRNKQFYRVTVP